MGWHLQFAPARAGSRGQRRSPLRSLFNSVAPYPNIWPITSGAETGEGRTPELRCLPSSVSGPRNMPDLSPLAPPCTQHAFEQSLIASISFQMSVPSQIIVPKNQSVCVYIDIKKITKYFLKFRPETLNKHKLCPHLVKYFLVSKQAACLHTAAKCLLKIIFKQSLAKDT